MLSTQYMLAIMIIFFLLALWGPQGQIVLVTTGLLSAQHIFGRWSIEAEWLEKKALLFWRAFTGFWMCSSCAREFGPIFENKGTGMLKVYKSSGKDKSFAYKARNGILIGNRELSRQKYA